MVLLLTLRMHAALSQATKTLMVTDMVVKVEDEPPKVVQDDLNPLLFHARDDALERVENTPTVRRKGWRRIVQVSCHSKAVACLSC